MLLDIIYISHLAKRTLLMIDSKMTIRPDNGFARFDLSDIYSMPPTCKYEGKAQYGMKEAFKDMNNTIIKR